MTDRTIAFVGAGNMASALIQGLINKGFDPGHIWACDRDQDKLAALRDECGIRTAPASGEMISTAGADVVVLAVKPQVLEQAAAALRGPLQAHPALLLSVAAGIPLDSLAGWTGPGQSIVRCMPNTPALVGAGASALIANEAVTEAQRRMAGDILSAVGTVSWLDREDDMDTVTALSGSGPAYFFLLMEAMQESAVKQGLDDTTARELCLQTAFGAARLAQHTDVGVGELRRRVTSPGGTTEAALNQLTDDHFKEIVGRALARAAERSRELARPSGDNN